MNTPLKPAAHLLRGSPLLQRLLRQAENLSRLQALVHRYQSPAIREQLRLGSYEDGVLTLVLADAVWVTRLRYQQEHLMQQLRQHAEFSGLRHIRLKIRPKSSAPAEAPEERRYLSDIASQNIRQGAQNIEDPQLREALQRLAKNTRSG